MFSKLIPTQNDNNLENTLFCLKCVFLQIKEAFFVWSSFRLSLKLSIISMLIITNLKYEEYS